MRYGVSGVRPCVFPAHPSSIADGSVGERQQCFDDLWRTMGVPRNVRAKRVYDVITVSHRACHGLEMHEEPVFDAGVRNDRTHRNPVVLARGVAFSPRNGACIAFVSIPIDYAKRAIVTAITPKSFGGEVNDADQSRASVR